MTGYPVPPCRPQCGLPIPQTHLAHFTGILHAWLTQILATVSRKSDTASAILYALTLWPALTRYGDDGRIEIDNSAAERALRGAWLRHILTHIAEHPVNRVEDFLPWNVKLNNQSN